MKNLLLIGILLFLFLFSCKRTPNYLEESLLFSGDNRPELEKVLEHYAADPKDSLKYRAAVFLIENMPGHYSYKNEKWLDTYYDELDNYYQSIAGDSVLNTRDNNVYHYSVLALALMRSHGIPVTEDFTPQWPDQPSSHSWNVLLNTKGKHITFSAGSNNPNELHKPEERMAKVFRRTYAINREIVGWDWILVNRFPLNELLILREAMATISLPVICMNSCIGIKVGFLWVKEKPMISKWFMKMLLWVLFIEFVTYLEVKMNGYSLMKMENSFGGRRGTKR